MIAGVLLARAALIATPLLDFTLIMSGDGVGSVLIAASCCCSCR